MNKQVIKLAHIVAVGIFLLVGVMVAAQQNQNTSQQNSNQQGRNTNGNTSRKGNANSSMNANDGGNMGTARQTGAGMGLSSADRKFIMEAAMGGMMEVELGRVAAQQGTSDAVKQFGQRMVDDHSRANTQLMQLASSKGITLPTDLDAKHRAELTKMSQLSGAAFDDKYAKEMVKDHEKDVSLFQKQSMRGTDADLKSFAASTLPTLQEHLSMARNLNGNRGGTMNSNSTSNGNANGSTSNRNSNNSNRR